MPHFMLGEMAQTVNETLGDRCTYVPFSGLPTVKTDVTFDKNNDVKNDFGVLIGFNVVASVLKSDVPEFENGDLIEDPEGVVWRVDAMTVETAAKWYFEVVKVDEY